MHHEHNHKNINNFNYESKYSANMNSVKKEQGKGNRADDMMKKKKVVHLRSIPRNSKSQNNQSSNSIGKKKFSIEHVYTEVAAF